MASKSNSSPISWALWSITIISLVTSVVALSFVLTNGKKDIVCVDAVKLISKYKGLEEVKKSLQKRNEDLKAKMDTLQQEYNASVEDYKKNKTSASSKEIKLMEQLVQTKYQTLVNFEQSTKGQMKKKDEELAAKVLTKVNDFLKRYGKQKGYTIILAATQMGNVAYTNEAYDITDEVVEGLNAEYDKMKH